MARLVLTRRLNESVIVHIDGQVVATVKLSRLDHNSARLTFVADPSVSIDREEIYERNKSAMKQQQEVEEAWNQAIK
jgi:carbon storage regulator CsrA